MESKANIDNPFAAMNPRQLEHIQRLLVEHNDDESSSGNIPEELYDRLMYWLQTSLGNSATNGTNCHTITATKSEILEIFVALARVFLKYHNRDPSALTTVDLARFVTSILLLQRDSDTPTDTRTKLRLLGGFYRGIYRQHGQLEDINQGIKCYTLAIAHTPEAGNGMIEILDAVGCCFKDRFAESRELSDIQQAVEYQTRALHLASDGHPLKATCLNNLGSSYLIQFGYLGSLPGLDFAFKYFTQAESLTPDSHPAKPSRLDKLGTTHFTKYKHLGQLEDLSAAIGYHTQANLLTSDEHLYKPTCLNNISLAHIARYERLGDVSDLNVTIECLSLSLSLLPSGHPERSDRLNNLGGAYYRRYHRLGRLSDLDSSVECLRLATDLIPDEHLSQHKSFVHLGKALFSRYECLEALADLDASITYLTQAVHLIPSGHQDLPVGLSNLGDSYQARFLRFGEVKDINLAVELQHRADLLTSENHPNKGSQLSSLGNAYITRYKGLKSISDLGPALECQRRAEFLTPDGHPDKPTHMHNLGTSYHTSYDHSDELSDINSAIWWLQQANLHTPDHYSKRSQRLCDLSSAYHARYQRLKASTDLDLAIECVWLAISVNYHTYNQQSVALHKLGSYLADRFNHSNRESDILDSIECYKKAAQSAVSDPQQRILSALEWAKVCIQYRPQSALGACQVFMSLIPQMVWHGEAVKRQYDYTIQIASGVLQAIIFAISAQLYDTALEWFEQGRSVAWSQLLLRSPLDDLCAIDHSLAEQLQDVANELQGSAVLQPSATAWPRDHDSQVGCVERRCRLMEEWERLIHQAQSMLDYNSVFIPKTAPQLVAAAQTRAIIAVLVTETTCGALVIRPRATEVEWLALKRLSYSKVLEARGHSISLSSGVLRGRPTFKASNHSNDNVLQMLWEDVVQPVLGFLGYHEVLPASQLPHITWCTTGPLSFLPLHAAGDYSKPGCSLIDYCISSYSPTIGALLKPPLDPCAYSGIAMVSQAFTPGRPPLPGTIREVDSIAKQAQHLHTTRLDGQSATRDSVMSAMEQHSWVHLACHASQSVTNPTTSAFHLHNGPLDLGTISRKRLKHADLAFLSACQTATGDKDLLEEAVHLAAGMLMAGYRTVIATRWSINDDDAPLVAQWFYEYMLKDGVPDSRKAAQGLHYAVNMLREKVGTTEYKRWAPFIHIGI